MSVVVIYSILIQVVCSCAVNPMKSPYFISTFYEKQQDMYAITAMEYIQGITFEKFMMERFREDKSESFRLFLILFLQILFSLDYAQSQISFTHFDLHLRNIMIETTDASCLEFPLGSSKYCIDNPMYKIKILDFEVSGGVRISKFRRQTTLQ